MLKLSPRDSSVTGTPPVFYELSFDVNRKIAELVPQKDVDYPPVDMFDIDVLAANGVNPQLVTSPLISSTIEETDVTLDQVNTLIDENETV